jgi:heat shock protein HslJ
MKYFTPAFLIGLAACQADETLTGYGAADKTWVLNTIDGAAFTARATISFPAEGSVTGQAPCNSFAAEQTAPYPWFSLSAARATRMACAELDQEQAFFTALSSMTLVEISGDVLILSNDVGGEMVFNAETGG